jgi:hypothetical protein
MTDIIQKGGSLIIKSLASLLIRKAEHAGQGGASLIVRRGIHAG